MSDGKPLILAQAYPHIQEHTHFLAGSNARKQPGKCLLSCIEISRQFLVYGGHTSNEAWVLTLQHPMKALYVRLGSPACRRRVVIG